MVAKSDWFEQQVLNVLRNQAVAGLSSVWVALHTASPTDAPLANELTGGGYGRVQVLAAGWTAPAPVDETYQITNAADVLWPIATANWASFTHFSLWTAQSSGNMVYHGLINGGVPVTILKDQQFVARAGQLAIRES